MHPTQSQLYADHHNFLRLLRCLEAEIACYESDHPWSADLPVILDIFDYVGFYAEKYHHVLEDVVFDVLLSKNVPQSEEILTMKAEHKELESITHHASQLFTSVANDMVVPVSELVGVTRDFLRRQVDHINRENQTIYPLLCEHVTDEEWDEVTASVARRKDPLFGKGIREEYEHLYHAILKAESGIVVGATARAINRPSMML